MGMHNKEGKFNLGASRSYLEKQADAFLAFIRSRRK
jgi:hypothetical protein